MAFEAAKLQAQVRANSTELASYLHDLRDWEKDIKQKEHKLQTGKLSLTKQPTSSNPTASSRAPIRSSQPAVALPSTAGSDQQRFAAHKDRGNSLYAKGDYNAAIAEYNQCAILLPLDPLPLSNRAQCWLKLHQWSEADRDCTAALELDRTNVKALYRRAMARKELGKLAEAAADIDRVIGVEPANKPAVQLQRDLQLAIKVGGGAVGPASRTGDGATVRGMEQPRKRLVIEEEAEDDEEEEEEVFTVKRGTTAASRTATAREEKEQSERITRGKDSTSSRVEDERKAAPPTSAVHGDPVDMDISDASAAALSMRSTGALRDAERSPASSSASSSKLPVSVASSPSPPSASAASSTSSSAASLDLRAPRSALDFDSQYRRVRQQPAQLAILLQLIPTADYASILRTALDSSLLSSIVKAVSSMHASVPPEHTQHRAASLQELTRFALTAVLPCLTLCMYCSAGDAAGSWHILSSLPSVPRFPLIASFLSAKDKQSKIFPLVCLLLRPCSPLTVPYCCVGCDCVAALSSAFSAVSSHSPAIADSAAVWQIAAKYGIVR